MKFALALLFLGAALAAPQNKIESRLASTLQKHGSADVLVAMKERTALALDTLKGRKYASRNERLNTVAHTLMNHADKSQAAARELLDSLKVKYDVLWITNQIYIRGATTEVVEALTAIDNVSSVSQDAEVQLDPVIPATPETTGALAEWGLETIEAPAAWALPGGNNGTGVIIGSIDTGGHPTHKDLKDNFVGEYGWRDFTLFGTQNPRDDNGHGTHTIGTMVGQNGIGVAPGAKWMACKGLNSQGSGTAANLLSCCQFMACPTLPNGVAPDCTKAPHVINNSWGGGQQNPYYNEVINAWKAANIIPVFAAGNAGPACQTIGSPSDSLAEVLAVAATNNTNSIAYFSSKGPTVGGRMKPDIGAPGQAIRSAWHTGDEEYNTISGTSMAAPHVAGVVALLKGHNPDISYEEVVKAIIDNANQEGVNDTGAVCNGISESVFPNYSFGHGIINARRALASLLANNAK